MPITARVLKTWAVAGVVGAAVLVITSMTASSSVQPGKGIPVAAVTAGAASTACASPITDRFAGRVGAEGRITRLYGAYFSRDPDNEGFAYWLEKISAGQWSNVGASNFFANSDEFARRYGADLSHADFLNRVYLNAFCREPDADGRAYWLGRIDAGLSRGQVVLLVSDSPEFRAVTGTD